MRLALLKRWPALMSEYGVMPWDVGRFTAAELDELVAHQNARYKADRQQQQRGR